MSPRNRLYFKVGSLSCRNLSVYGNFLKDIINFVALFCTFSIFSISPFLNGHHTELEYSKCGLTITVKQYKWESRSGKWELGIVIREPSC